MTADAAASVASLARAIALTLVVTALLLASVLMEPAEAVVVAGHVMPDHLALQRPPPVRSPVPPPHPSRAAVVSAAARSTAAAAFSSSSSVAVAASAAASTAAATPVTPVAPVATATVRIAAPTAIAAAAAIATPAPTRAVGPWDGNWRGSPWPGAKHVQFARSEGDGGPQVGPVGRECRGHGVYNPWLHECRCTAGWSGRFCATRSLRSCNTASAGGTTNYDALCAGNCDDERGHCYCAGLASPFQRSLPHHCAPWAHKRTKLPDGRPAYPVRSHAEPGAWQMANLVYERPNKERPWLGEWARYYLKPFDFVYGELPGNPIIPSRGHWKPLAPKQRGWCEANLTQRSRMALECGGCYEGRTGRFCEKPKCAPATCNARACAPARPPRTWSTRPPRTWSTRATYVVRAHQTRASHVCAQHTDARVHSRWRVAAPTQTRPRPRLTHVACAHGAVRRRMFCLRDCMGRGTCDMGFCWCHRGWVGIDCGQRSGQRYRKASHWRVAAPAGEAPRLQDQQKLPSRVAASPLRVYVYDMPSQFTTLNLQYRTSGGIGLHRTYSGDNRSHFHAGSLYAMEPALHEWLLDSPLRTHDSSEVAAPVPLAAPCRPTPRFASRRDAAAVPPRCRRTRTDAHGRSLPMPSPCGPPRRRTCTLCPSTRPRCSCGRSPSLPTSPTWGGTSMRTGGGPIRGPCS